MLASRIIGLAAATALVSGAAYGQVSGDSAPWLDHVPNDRLHPAPIINHGQPDPIGLPGMRPRMTMSLPLGQDSQAQSLDASDRGTFSWSLEAWQLNTASLAHIQCRTHTLTLDSFLAEDCQFVDQPVPENSVNLVQFRGEWMAAPGLRFGLGAFRNQQQPGSPALSDAMLSEQGAIPARHGFDRATPNPIDGVDLNVSFGLSTERVGDFLVGLQVARYRQRMSLTDLGLGADSLSLSLGPESDFFYANSAQFSLGWRRGSLSGDLLGHHRDAPLWLTGTPTSAAYNSFDLEFSWRPKNASLSIGISNVLDNAPRLEESEAAGMDDPMEHVFGRIPYVRYKHDL
jgi:hypothetical protein